MIVTVDTNVIYASLFSNQGTSHQILKWILEEKLRIALSPPIFLEYYDVLSRKKTLAKIGLTIQQIEDILDLLVLLARKQSIYFLLRPNLLDEKDNIFSECAFASNSRYLITSNVRHFQGSELKGFRFKVLTPGAFYKQWETSHE